MEEVKVNGLSYPFKAADFISYQQSVIDWELGPNEKEVFTAFVDVLNDVGCYTKQRFMKTVKHMDETRKADQTSAAAARFILGMIKWMYDTYCATHDDDVI